MSRPAAAPRADPVRGAAVLVALALLFTAVAQLTGLRALASAGPVGVGTVPAAAAEADRAPGAVHASPPTGLRVPALRVVSRLVELHVDAKGELEVPTDFARAGWWADGPAPGDRGAAVFVGHVDSTEGPAVFYKVKTLKPGDLVQTIGADGRTLDFRVRAVRQYSKRRLPSAIVYARSGPPALRLITCGGAFDRRTGHYRDNVVVFAELDRSAASFPGKTSSQPRGHG